jgi:23S rRNA (guanosine2251-2'-O)-methyltransferase
MRRDRDRRFHTPERGPRRHEAAPPAQPNRDRARSSSGSSRTSDDRFRSEHDRGPIRTDVVFGIEPVRELVVAAPELVRTLYIRAGDERKFEEEISRARRAGAQVAAVDDRELMRLIGRDARHQGIAAIVREYNYASFEDVLRERPDPLLVVDGVTDPRNLGATLRSAEGAGVSTIVLARDRTAAITPAAIKSSAGAWIHMRVARCGNVARALGDLKEAGYWIAALAPGGGLSIYDLDTTRKLAIVVGSEGKGVREIVKKTADFVVDIPMRGKVASLNVSVATAVALYEIARRRGAGATSGS